MNPDDTRTPLAPAPTGRAGQKAATRDRIVAAARAAFAEGGILATTTAEVACRAGVSHGAVFAHFPTRDALVVAVIESFGDGVRAQLHRLASHEATVREVLAAHLEAIAADEALYARLVAERGLLPPEARVTLVAIQSALSHHLDEALATEARSCQVRDDLPLAMLFNTWIGLVNHYLVDRDLFAPNGSVVARRGGELLDFYMELIAPK